MAKKKQRQSKSKKSSGEPAEVRQAVHNNKVALVMGQQEVDL